MSEMPDDFKLQYDLQNKHETTTYTIRSLMDIMEEQEQRLSAQQRDSTTWDPSWCSQYIKSLFEGMNTTPFLLLRDSSNDGLVIHDGGHRDHVIQEFTKGRIGVRLDDIENNIYWFVNNPSVQKNKQHNNVLLSKRWTRKFKTSTVQVDMFTDLNTNECTELFRRINTSLDLSAGEQINAFPTTPINDMVRDLSIAHSEEKCLPVGGEKGSKRKYLQEKIGLLAFNLYSPKSDGLEHTEGGKLFVAKYKKFLDKELSDPEAYPTSKLKRNFSIVLKVMDSIERTPRVRDMVAVSNIANISPVEDVVFTLDMLTHFLRATTTTPTKHNDAPWVGLWNLTHNKDGIMEKAKQNSGSIPSIRQMRTAAKLWYERAGHAL